MPVFFPRSAFIILLFALMAQADAREFDEKAITHVDFPEWFSKSPFMELAEELDNSRSDNKQGLMVLFTTEGCSYCTAFIEQALGDETIAARVQQQLVSIGMEIFDDVYTVDCVATGP